MSTLRNRRVYLRELPTGLATPDIFELREEDVPEDAAQGVLVRVLYLAMDAGLVNRLRRSASYAQPIRPGEAMPGTAIGEVVASPDPALPVGSFVRGALGWQEYYAASDATGLTRLDAAAADLPLHLGPFGNSGPTAYFGLLDFGRPKPGETVLVSAAASAVGMIAGQIARIMGCRVVGIAGSGEKCAWLTGELGFDAAVSYRSPDFAAELRGACPNGVDVYFDNVSGDIAEAVLPLYNTFARIVLCGRLSLAHLQDVNEDRGIRDNSVIIAKRMSKQGFLVFDHHARFPEALAQLRQWHREGKLTLTVDMVEGIEKAPEAFIRPLTGRNIGKQLVKLAEPGPGPGCE